jgi:hypothetical protein
MTLASFVGVRVIAKSPGHPFEVGPMMADGLGPLIFPLRIAHSIQAFDRSQSLTAVSMRVGSTGIPYPNRGSSF